jgi:hypothetical protein
VQPRCPMFAGRPTGLSLRLQLWLCRRRPHMRTFVFYFSNQRHILGHLKLIGQRRRRHCSLGAEWPSFRGRHGRVKMANKCVDKSREINLLIFFFFYQLIVQPHQIVVDIEYDCVAGEFCLEKRKHHSTIVAHFRKHLLERHLRSFSALGSPQWHRNQRPVR